MVQSEYNRITAAQQQDFLASQINLQRSQYIWALAREPCGGALQYASQVRLRCYGGTRVMKEMKILLKLVVVSVVACSDVCARS